MILCIFLICNCLFLSSILCLPNSTTKRTVDDYYLNYDYELTSNSSENLELRSDSLILPNPASLDSRYTIDILPNVELPEDSLADTDLRDHDFIDNLMYVYYGSHNRNDNSYGPEIIIIGSVLSCAAQLLTIFCVLLRKNSNGKREMNNLFLHMIGCLCFSNLLFMLGVYSTKTPIKCQVIALMLHYLHLLTAFWIFLYGYYIYRRFCNSDLPKTQMFLSLAYGLPAFLTVVSYIISPKSYETKKFCFVSVQKGMIINYMLPVSILIVLSTTYCLNGIRKINMELSKLELNSSAESLNALRNELESGEGDKKQEDNEVISLRECKRCLKVLCIVQTSYDIVWFVAVLALENVNYSNSMSIIYSVTSCLLNWYVFARTKAFLPLIMVQPQVVDDGLLNVEQEKNLVSNNVVSNSRRGSSDSIPLLINSETCTEMRELRQEYISTISS